MNGLCRESPLKGARLYRSNFMYITPRRVDDWSGPKSAVQCEQETVAFERGRRGGLWHLVTRLLPRPGSARCPSQFDRLEELAWRLLTSYMD